MILFSLYVLFFVAFGSPSAPVSAVRFFGRRQSGDEAVTKTLKISQGGELSAKPMKKIFETKTSIPFTPAPPETEQHQFLEKQQTGGKRKDSIESFASDVSRVLNELRGDEFDPTVAKVFHSKIRPTFAVTWTHAMWQRHTSRLRFVEEFIFWPKSALLRRVLPQLCGLLVWTFCAIRIVENKSTALSNIKFPMTSLSLVSGFVASLLALRSNQGLARMMDGRMIFGKSVLYTRDMASLIKHFVHGQHPELGLQLARHLCLFSWMLKGFLRGSEKNGSDHDIIRCMLSPPDANYIVAQRKPPVAILMRLRQALAHLSHKGTLSIAEEMAIDHTIQSMDSVIMQSERLVASPIPPLFTTHAGRLMVFYLFFLPLALHSSGSMNAIGTILTVAVVGYAMLGLDEISHLMEQPFLYAPLFDLCKNSMRDVADAFCIEPPSLHTNHGKHYNPPKPQPYWSSLSNPSGFE